MSGLNIPWAGQRPPGRRRCVGARTHQCSNSSDSARGCSGGFRIVRGLRRPNGSVKMARNKNGGGRNRLRYAFLVFSV